MNADQKNRRNRRDRRNRAESENKSHHGGTETRRKSEEVLPRMIADQTKNLPLICTDNTDLEIAKIAEIAKESKLKTVPRIGHSIWIFWQSWQFWQFLEPRRRASIHLKHVSHWAHAEGLSVLDLRPGKLPLRRNGDADPGVYLHRAAFH